jgi:hypothetical protein
MLVLQLVSRPIWCAVVVLVKRVMVYLQLNKNKNRQTQTQTHTHKRNTAKVMIVAECCPLFTLFWLVLLKFFIPEHLVELFEAWSNTML